MRNACQKCHHLMEEDGSHECPSPEYLAVTRRLIHEAAIYDEMYGGEDREPFSVPLETFAELVQTIRNDNGRTPNPSA